MRRSEFDFFLDRLVLVPMTRKLTRWNRRELDVQYWVQLLRQRYAGMKMIVGRDKLDEIQVRVCECDDVCVSFLRAVVIGRQA